MPGLPGPFAALARQVAGEITDVTDCSWPRDSSAVWRIASASGGCWYLKHHSSDRFHAREVAALQIWARVLGPERAPELAAADPELLIMVITAVPGRPVLELQLSAREEREAHRQAGLLLGCLHESTQAPGAGADVSRLTSRVDRHLDQAGGLITPAQRTLARDCATGSPGSAPTSRPWPATGTSSLVTGSGTRLAASWASSTGNVPSPPRPSATSSGWNTAHGTTGPISASTSSQDTGARSPRRSARCWPATPSLMPSAAFDGVRLMVTVK